MGANIRCSRFLSILVFWLDLAKDYQQQAIRGGLNVNQTETNSVDEEFTNMGENLSDVNQADEDLVEELPHVKQLSERKISGFWRRLLAIIIDMIILGVLGLLLGDVFFDTFCQMGSQGFWVGLIIAMFYFGWTKSSRKNGQTIGKRIMKIRVVDINGNTIGFKQSLRRSLILLVPFMFTPISQGTIAQLINAIMIFIMVGIVYLYIFNVKTRQTIHDLISGTFVVNADYKWSLDPSPVWMKHYAILSVIGIVLVGFTMFGAPKLLNPFILPGMTETLNVLLKDPNISNANIYNGETTNAKGRTTRIDVGVTVKKMPTPTYAKAEEVSKLALNLMPAAKEKDLLAVTITHGYSIGIAYYRKIYVYTGSPKDWEINPKKIAQNPQGTNISAGIGK